MALRTIFTRRNALIGLIVVGLFGGVVVWFWERAAPPTSRFQTAPVRRGELLAIVAATGTIEPEEVIDIGAQVVGMIREFGPDPNDSSRTVDFLSAVEAGTVLARIDDAVYQARLERAVAVVGQSEAQVEQDRANLRRAEADRLQVGAKYHQAERDLARAKALVPSRSMSEQDYDAYLAAYDVAKANLGVADAVVDQATATVKLAEKSAAVARADRREAQQNLDYTVIRSPVKGAIVDRRVNVGQTVVSSLSAPSLFLIAKDLTRLQVWASVNEADVGRVRTGQPARFTVDAYPGEEFRGEVSQVRLNATMTQNVVTYTVVLTTGNPGGKLIPYLTANVQFEVGRCRGSLLVPTAALRWQPQPQQVGPEVRAELAAGGDGAAVKPAHDQGRVWVKVDGFVRPVDVRTGLTDGVSTEITGGDLHEGQMVVVGEEAPPEGEEATSPFTPHLFGGKRQ